MWLYPPYFTRPQHNKVKVNIITRLCVRTGAGAIIVTTAFVTVLTTARTTSIVRPQISIYEAAHHDSYNRDRNVFSKFWQASTSQLELVYRESKRVRNPTYCHHLGLRAVWIQWLTSWFLCSFIPGPHLLLHSSQTLNNTDMMVWWFITSGYF